MSFKVHKQYKIATTGAALTALQLPGLATLRGNGVKPQIRVMADGADVVFKLGDNTVAASRTVTSSAYPDGNAVAYDRVPEIFDIDPDDNYISTIAEDGATACTLFVTIGSQE
jgi:hypothetical protein